MSPAPRNHLAWAKGGHAEIVRVHDDLVELRSTAPAPPGARLEAKLASRPEHAVKIKSHGTRREPDGSFALSGRLIDATRELRELLSALVGSG